MYLQNLRPYFTATGLLVRISFPLPFVCLIIYKGYVNMSPPKYDLVVEDCDEALKLDIMYIKALNRRAAALEALGRYQESLRGALCPDGCCIHI
jgi:hypothetical protein